MNTTGNVKTVDWDYLLDNMNCPYCNENNREDYVYCWHCGHPRTSPFCCQKCLGYNKQIAICLNSQCNCHEKFNKKNISNSRHTFQS